MKKAKTRKKTLLFKIIAFTLKNNIKPSREESQTSKKQTLLFKIIAFAQKQNGGQN